MSVFPGAPYDWVQISAFFTVAVGILGGLLWLGQMMLSRNFASHHDHMALSGKLTNVERQMEGVATKVELRSLESRLGPVETGIAVMGAEMKASRESNQRTEHMVSLLLEHQLRKEAVQ